MSCDYCGDGGDDDENDDFAIDENKTSNNEVVLSVISLNDYFYTFSDNFTLTDGTLTNLYNDTDINDQSDARPSTYESHSRKSTRNI